MSRARFGFTVKDTCLDTHTWIDGDVYKSVYVSIYICVYMYAHTGIRIR